MQFKLSILSTVVLATLAAATPMRRTGAPASQCDTGDLQCCDSTGKAGSDPVAKILGLLGIVVQDLNVLVGVTCTPITVIGAGGDSCTAQPVCCTDNSFHGAVALGCTPVDLNL